MNFKFLTKYLWLLCISIITIYFIITYSNDLPVLLFVLSVSFLLLIKYPEFCLAILFNGTMIYFYMVYKMDYMTTTNMTGIFYGFFSITGLIGSTALYFKEKKKLLISRCDILIFVLSSLIVISFYIFSTGNKNAIIKISFLPVMCLIPFVSSRLVLDKHRIRDFLVYSALMAIVFLIPAYYELLTNPMFIGYTKYSMFIVGERDNPILLGITFSVPVLIIYGWALSYKKSNILILPIIFLCTFLVLRSGSRGAILSLTASLFILVVILTYKSEKQITYNAIRSIIMLITLVIVVILILPGTTSDFLVYSTTPEARMYEQSGVSRLVEWDMAINEFMESPAIGVGFGNSGGGLGYPHNIIIEIAAEYGIIGIIILFMVVLQIVFMNHEISYVKSALIKRLLIVLLSFSFIEAMFSGYLTQQSALFISIGLFNSLYNSEKNELVK